MPRTDNEIERKSTKKKKIDLATDRSGTKGCRKGEEEGEEGKARVQIPLSTSPFPPSAIPPSFFSSAKSFVWSTILSKTPINPPQKETELERKRDKILETITARTRADVY